MAASNAQASCPSYPIGLCTTAGFCVRVDTLADANQSTDNPAAQLVQSATPTFATQMAMAGTADLVADSEVGCDAGAGVLSSVADASAGSSGGEAPGSTGTTNGLSVFRANDLVFSGPAPFVQATLRFVLDADFSVVATGADGEEALGSVRLDLSGAICNTGTLVSFSGARAFRDLDPLVGDSTREYTTSNGVLADIPLDASTEFSVGPFTAPTGEALQFELRIAQDVIAIATGGSASSSADFVVRLGDESSGPVFELPSGYVANSAALDIVDSHLPEPDPTVAAAGTLTTLAWLARRRRT